MAPVVAPAAPELTASAEMADLAPRPLGDARQDGLGPVVLAGVVTALAVVALALQGGAYDVLVRQSAAVLAWWAVAAGALLLPAPRLPRATGLAVLIAGAGIAAWVAVGLTHTVSSERTAIELARAVAHLAPLVLVGVVLPTRCWQGVVVGALVGAVVVVAVAFASRLWPSIAGSMETLAAASTTQRLAFPLGYWNAVGSLAAITAVALLAVGTHAPRGWMRALALAPIPLAVATAYLTYSRSAIGATAVGLLVLALCSRHRATLALASAGAAVAGAVAVLAVRGAPEIARATGTSGSVRVAMAVLVAGAALAALGAVSARGRLDDVRLPRRFARVAVGASVAVALLAGLLAVDRYGRDAWQQFTTTQDVSAADPSARLTSLNGTRIDQWRAALDAWREHRLAGTGPGTFEFTWNARATSSEFVRDAHNAYLEALTEQGVVGLVLLLAFAGAALAAAVVAVRRTADASAQERGLVAAAVAAVAMFLVGTSVDWFWELTSLAVLVLVLLGALIAAGKADAMGPDLRAASGARALGRGGRAALAACALAAILIQLPGLVGTAEVRRSQQALAAGDLAAAQQRADDAVAAMPWAATPRLQQALLAERRGDLPAARAWLERAMELDPKDWRYPLTLARVAAEAGDDGAALRAFREARELRPTGSFFR